MFTADKHNIFEKKKPFGASSHDRKKQLLKKNKTYNTVTTRPDSDAPNAN